MPVFGLVFSSFSERAYIVPFNEIKNCDRSPKILLKDKLIISWTSNIYTTTIVTLTATIFLTPWLNLQKFSMKYIYQKRVARFMKRGATTNKDRRGEAIWYPHSIQPYKTPKHSWIQCVYHMKGCSLLMTRQKIECCS